MTNFEITIKFSGSLNQAKDIENYFLSLFESFDTNLPEPLIDNKNVQLVDIDKHEII